MRLVQRLDVAGIVFGLVFLGIGVAYLLDRMGYWTLRAEVVWPAVLIAVGVALLLGALVRRARHPA